MWGRGGDPEHRCYTGPANKDIVGLEEEKWMQKTEWLVEESNRLVNSERLLWCRGVLPFNRAGRLAVPGKDEEEVAPFQ